MQNIVLLLIGLIIGGAIAWVIASARSKASFASQLGELERRTGSADGAVAELRNQVQSISSILDAARSELSTERGSRVKAETELAESAKNLQEQKLLLDDSQRKLSDTFKALSDDALKSNNEAFLQLAKKSLEAVVIDAKGDLGKRQEAIDGIVKPLQTSLNLYEEHLKELEKNRQKAYGSLEEQLKALSSTHQQLQKETGNLVNALRTPQVSGRWGEMALRRVVELAGMSKHCDYVEQISVDSETGRLRPDMVIRLPADREIVVDSKTSTDAYMKAMSATSEAERTAAMERHAQQVRNHMNSLAAKSYWDQFAKAPEFVIMFIPGESFFAAAVDSDQDLLEDAMAKRVVLATPTTLIALLRAVAFGWRQEQVTKNAQEISELGKQLYERLAKLCEHFTDMGKSLNKATEAYNKAVRSMEARVFPSARRFKELGSTAGSDIPVLEPVESLPRELDSPDDSEEQD